MLPSLCIFAQYSTHSHDSLCVCVSLSLEVSFFFGSDLSVVSFFFLQLCVCVCVRVFFSFFLCLVSRLSCASHTFSGKYNSQILQLCLSFLISGMLLIVSSLRAYY